MRLVQFAPVLLLLLPLLLPAQNPDSLLVAQEIDSLLRLNNNLREQQNFEEALKVVGQAREKAFSAYGKVHAVYGQTLYSQAKNL